MGLTSTGYTTQSLTEVRDEINTILLSLFPTLNTTELAEIEQQFVGVFAERIALVNELNQSVYSNSDINQATGDSLNLKGNLLGVSRLQETPSTVTARVTGTSATVVPAGTLFSVEDEPTIIVATDADVTIPVGLSIDVECTATDNGPQIINSGTLIEIDTPVAGLNSVTNAIDGVLGRNIETDAAYRIRLADRKSSTDAGTPAGIKEAILATNVDGATTIVEHVTVKENETMAVVAGRPAKSFETYVYQTAGATSLDSTIAQAVLDAKPAGIETYGTISETATDVNGDSRTVEFSRVTDIPIHTIVDITGNSLYPIDGDDQVKAAVIAYGNALGVGVDVNEPALQAAIVTSVAGIDTIVVKIGKSDPPTASDNIVIDDGTGGAVEVSTWDTTNVDVNS